MIVNNIVEKDIVSIVFLEDINYHYGKAYNKFKSFVYFNEDGLPYAVDFMEVSEGIDLKGLPFFQEPIIKELCKLGHKVLD